MAQEYHGPKNSTGRFVGYVLECHCFTLGQTLADSSLSIGSGQRGIGFGRILTVGSVSPFVDTACQCQYVTAVGGETSLGKIGELVPP